MQVSQGGLGLGSSYNAPPYATSSYLTSTAAPPTGTAVVGDLTSLKNELSQIFVSEIRNLRSELQREREQSQAQAQSFERRLDALEHAVREIQNGRSGSGGAPHANSSSVLGSAPTFAPAGPVSSGLNLSTTPVRLERSNPILEEKRAALATTVSLYEFARSEVESLRMRQSLEKEKQALQQQMSFERRELSSLVQRTSDRTLAKVETLSREIETLNGKR